MTRDTRQKYKKQVRDRMLSLLKNDCTFLRYSYLNSEKALFFYVQSNIFNSQVKQMSYNYPVQFYLTDRIVDSLEITI